MLTLNDVYALLEKHKDAVPGKWTVVNRTKIRFHPEDSSHSVCPLGYLAHVTAARELLTSSAVYIARQMTEKDTSRFIDAVDGIHEYWAPPIRTAVKRALGLVK